ncbi:MAG: hypothetical protein NDF55_10920 [archaeon GB-1867-005]|nr:hypothetical protein [Candidatus Culexmicrobium cathedralense]
MECRAMRRFIVSIRFRRAVEAEDSQEACEIAWNELVKAIIFTGSTQFEFEVKEMVEGEVN